MSKRRVVPLHKLEEYFFGFPSTSGEPRTASGKKIKKRATEKPSVVLDYNKGKTGIDISDQMASYAGSLRKGIKWYRKLAFSLLCGLSVVNAWVLYKKTTGEKIGVRRFREQLVEKLLIGVEPKVSTKKIAHKWEPRFCDEGEKIRRRCTSCYSESVKDVGRAKARKSCKMVYNYCKNCPQSPQLCLPCFNKLH